MSALVVKGSFFLVIRLWFDVMPQIPGWFGAQTLCTLGAAEIFFGCILVLRQQRLKLLVAYSTIAQICYLFLIFPLAFNTTTALFQAGSALTGGIMQTISHATAKAAMFMSAGMIYAAVGHARIAGLAGVARALPITVLAFTLGGICLLGLPPRGGFLAKWLHLNAAIAAGQWWRALVILAGGLLTSGYMVLVLSRALATSPKPFVLHSSIPK